MEFQRNRERYEFLRWGQKAFDNFRAVPPNVGIVHQVNLEFLAKCVFLREDQAGPVAVPDTLVGTDSHTTMINGLGVVGWGVGGIEAEAVMLGQPLYMLMPEVVGFELTGELPPGATATDLVLTVTEMLRQRGRRRQVRRILWRGRVAHVAGRPSHDRQYGSRIRGHDGLFPGGRRDTRIISAARAGRTKKCNWWSGTRRSKGLFRTDDAPVPTYTTNVSLDLGDGRAVPGRPQASAGSGAAVDK